MPGMVATVARPITAGLFPGQGAQTGDLLERTLRVVPELVERCVDLVGEDPFGRVGESTRFAQPAIFCASIAGWSELRSHVQPQVLAGHSLGELSALVAAGALSAETGLRLAVLRGELMDAAGGGEEGMLALLGAPHARALQIAEACDVVIANDNAPGQTVLAGPLASLRRASAATRESGARAIMLEVAGAFHSPAMAGAVAPFRAALEDVELLPPTIPVMSGSTAAPFADIRAELAAAIVRPVRWRETMQHLAGTGVDTFVDFGPGNVLARLVSRNLPAARVLDSGQLVRFHAGSPSGAV